MAFVALNATFQFIHANLSFTNHSIDYWCQRNYCKHSQIFFLRIYKTCAFYFSCLLCFMNCNKSNLKKLHVSSRTNHINFFSGLPFLFIGISSESIIIIFTAQCGLLFYFFRLVFLHEKKHMKITIFHTKLNAQTFSFFVYCSHYFRPTSNKNIWWICQMQHLNRGIFQGEIIIMSLEWTLDIIQVVI